MGTHTYLKSLFQDLYVHNILLRYNRDIADLTVFCHETTVIIIQKTIIENTFRKAIIARALEWI